MKFAVHTNQGLFIVDAKNPADARHIVSEKYSAQINKVKLVGGQKKEKEKQA